MAARGPYAKGVAKREAILEAALAVVSELGYSGATVKQIADVAGVSQNAVMHYFGSKEAIFVEILRRHEEVDDDAPIGGPFDDATVPTLATLIEVVDQLAHQYAEVPGLAQLYTRLSAEASDQSHPLHAYFAERHSNARTYAGKALRAMQATGQIRADLDPDLLATMLVALSDGFQLQWLYDESIDMPSGMRALISLIDASADITAASK